MNDFDELDRALFALPLEEPPAGLRESILRATVYGPVANAIAFNFWEVAGIGAALAVAVWLALLLVADKEFAMQASILAVTLFRAAANPATLVWCAMGGWIAIVVTSLNAPSLQPIFRKRG
jgi:hypothetical protein